MASIIHPLCCPVFFGKNKKKQQVRRLAQPHLHGFKEIPP
jgi:hypothetical protein